MYLAIYEAKPRIALCENLHLSPCTIYRFKYGPLYIRIGSSQKHNHYLLLHNTGNSLRVKAWRDNEIVDEAEV